MKQADCKGYTEAYTRWATLKKQGRIFTGDQEPRPSDFGLIAWAAEQIRKRVDRETNRPV
jgi:hypothetical protein